jgi:hypothetical protein
MAVTGFGWVDSARAVPGVAASADGHGLILATPREEAEPATAGSVNLNSKSDQASHAAVVSAAASAGEAKGALVEGVWPGTFSVGVMAYNGQAAITVDKQQVRLKWVARYRSQGMDRMFHQIDEEDLFVGQLEGRTLTASREHLRMRIDGVDVPQMQVAVALSATISPDGRSLQGTVSGYTVGILKLRAPVQ